MKKTTLVLLATALMTACIDDHTPDDSTPADYGGRALVLCEGAWGNNDASLTMVSTQSGDADNQWFEEGNGRGLGDVAQDMLLYGTKAYVTVTFSNSLEAIDTATGQSIRHDMGNMHPRSIAVHDGRLFISCYGGHTVVVCDTTDLDHHVATLQLGDYQPEGLAVADGRLFVASSWIQRANQAFDYDSSLYVFDLSTLTLDTIITVGLNPQTVVTLDDNHVAVNHNGDYGSIPSGCAIVNTTTLTVSQIERSTTGITATDGTLYAFYRQGYGSSMTTSYWCYNAGAFTQLPIDADHPYSISVDTVGNIYITTDGNYVASGDVLCYTPDGALLWRTEAGILPKKVIVLR